MRLRAPRPITDPPAAPRSAPRGRALAIFALVLTFFFSPALLGPDQFLFRDTGRMHHPVKTFIAAELRAGRLPQWNPYMGLGIPLPGTAVDAIHHPFNLLFVLLPFEAAFKGWILLCYVLAGLGAFGWARRVGLSFAPALASGLAFSLSGFLVSSSDNLTYLTAAAAVPWLLWAFEEYLATGGPRRLGAVGVASWLCAVAGDPLAWAIAVGALAVRGALPAPARTRSVSLRRTGLAAAAAVVGSAPALLPVALWSPFTRRVAEGLDSVSRGRWDLHPLRALEFALPSVFETGAGRLHGGAFEAFVGSKETGLPWVASIYLGVACLALAVFALRRSAAARLLAGAAALLTWAATGQHLGFSWVASQLPVLGSFRYWEKLTLWPTLFLTLAAGLGLERLLQDRRAARRFGLATGAVALLDVAAWGTLELLADAWRSAIARPGVAAADAEQLLDNLQRATGTTSVILMLLALASVAYARGLLARAGPAVLVAIVALDVASANSRAYVLAPPETIRTGEALTRTLRARPEPARIVTPFDLASSRWPELGEFEATWRWGAGTLAAAWNVGERVANFDLYTGLTPSRLDEFQLDPVLQRLVPSEGLWGVQYVVVPGRPSLAAAIGMSPPFQIEAADRELPAYLVRLPHRPRAYLAARVVSTDAAGARAFALEAASVASDRTVIEAPLPAEVPEGPPGTAVITAFGTDRVEVEVRALRRALLVLNDQDAPGWQADVDGQPTPIVTANYLVRGVWVESGPHRVLFRYRAPGLLAGWIVLAMGLAALGIWALALRRRRVHSASDTPG